MTYQYYQMANYTVFRKLVMKRLETTGLTLGQPKILDFLYDHDGVNQTEIAAACYIEAASITSALNGMEKKGLIHRKRMNGNRRAYFIFLTDEGKRMADIVKHTFLDLEKELFSKLPSETAERITSELIDVHGVLVTMLRQEDRNEA